MKPVALRPAEPEDSEFAYTVKRAAFREYAEQVWGWDESEQRRRHDQRFAVQSYQVVSVGGQDSGLLACEETPDCLKVNQLFIAPKHQGQGIGRQCMLLAIDRVRRLGMPVRLCVLRVNPRADAFCELLGFVRTGETDVHDLMEWTP